MPLSFDEAIRRIAVALDPKRIILFGSRARGDHQPESDYDVLVVMKDAPIDHFELAAQAFRAARGKGFSMDVIVLTESEVAQSLEDRADFVFHAMKDARVVYEKALPRDLRETQSLARGSTLTALSA